ncbi:MAG: ROK family protein [Alphaproteobacteria bacterium]|nr:ROK family protein [Alphaproteobacteria bacterium]
MRIGIDLGGTKIEGIVLDRDGGIVTRKRVATPAGDYAATVGAVRDLVAALEQEAGARCPVGVGGPGSISPTTGLLRNANSTCLNGKPLDRDLAVALGREVRLANDANCFALSEAIDGAGRGHSVVFGVILGTGVGGGVVVDGRILTGPNSIAGEWGHNPLPWPDPSEKDGPACYCGKAGCIETWISGPGFAAAYARSTGMKATTAEIVTAARTGEECAQAALEALATRIGKSLATVANVLDPDVIVLGGGLSNVAALYELVPPMLSRHAFSDAITTPVRRALHGDSSGVRGAAWLWPPA